MESDNLPLISFFKKPIDKLPIRIQRWMLALQTFKLTVKHISGKANCVADALSRVPVDEASQEEHERSEDMVCMIAETSPISIERIKEANRSDREFLSILEAVRSNWKKTSGTS